MKARASDLWENAVSSLWFVPTLFVAGAVILSFALLYVDENILTDLGASDGLLFGGTAGAARSLLSTIATSLITVVSVAFSIAIVALQQASTQYSPRVLRNFTSDRGSQVVLGTYIATFVYALLIMRGVREAAGGQTAFVPTLSVSVAVVLALVSAGMLVYYISHISTLLQVSSILSSLSQGLHKEIDTLFPGQFGRESEEPRDPATLVESMVKDRRGRESVVRSESAGYLRSIDEGQLEKATRNVHLMWVLPGVGDYLLHGSVLARVWSERPLDSDQQDEVRASFVLDQTRSIYQDPLFGIRQMVDIGVKALSTGINDPTTAEESLSSLADVVTHLLEKEFPSPLRQSDRGTLYLFSRPGFPDFVDASFSQIRRAARNDLHVTLYLLDVLGKLAEEVPNTERALPLRRQVEEILAALDSTAFIQKERQSVRDRARDVLAALDRVR
jgi:uncharacterized membrane protein